MAAMAAAVSTSEGAAKPSLAALDVSIPSDLADLYDVDRTIVNLDAGYYGAMPTPTFRAYVERLAWANRVNSLFLRNALGGMDRDLTLDQSRAAVARLIGAEPGEIVLCSGGTEALYSMILNFRAIAAGDSVIYSDVDYDEMQFAMEYLRQSRGANVVRFTMPEPHTRANVLEAYERVLTRTPRARLLLLTHLSNRNGLIPPVKDITAMARARGVDVVLDSSHAIGAVPFTVADTGADFIGFSLHKWVAAPLGTGGIYIRKSRLPDVLPWFGNGVYGPEDIRSRVSTGTVDFAARLTVTDAVSLHERIGPERKLARLRFLRNYWVDSVREMDGIEMMLPDEGNNYAAITSFRLPGMKTITQARQVHSLFLKKYGVMVVARAGLDSGACLRVTPALFNTTDELDRLVAAVAAERGFFG